MNDKTIGSISTHLLTVLSPTQARHYRVVPIRDVDDILSVAISERSDSAKVRNELSVLLGRKLEWLRLSDDEMTDILNEHYKKTYENSGTKSFDIRASDAFLTLLIKEARQLGSSDIHIEKYEQIARIRLRIDGVLVERYSLDLAQYPIIVNKLKIMAHLDIAEKRLPQDGRITFKKFSEEFDIRMSVVPTLYGEKIVLRLLNRDAADIEISTLGMSTRQLVDYKEGLRKPNGIVLISGPTGSGKTTTLYASLKVLNTAERNILTIEDPVEYTLEGVNQVQLKESIGLDFASALKSFLRQDPDIIMLGEIRDVDTAEMAIRASLTGHLVLSTIHAPSAWSAISRLVDMGIPSYMLANTMNTSVAQRLVRRLCDCKEALVLERSDMPRNFDGFKGGVKAFGPIGCDKCFNTGYRGRIAIYEVLRIDSFFEDGIRSNLDFDDSDFRSKGVSILSDQASELLLSGQTSIAEVYPLLMK